MNRADMMGGLADMTLPPEAPSWEAEHRWNVAPPRRMPVAEAYQMGQLAGMDAYNETDPLTAYGGYDKHRAALQRLETAPDLGGLPLIPSGPQVSAGHPAVNRAVDVASELGAGVVIPQSLSPLDVGLMVAGGPVGGKLLRGGAAALGALFEPDKAEAGAIGKAGKVLRAAKELPVEAKNWTGIRAYHGSPHDFDRFDISKIGTGEGAQMYGHGLYFAENPEVAHNYKMAGPEASRQLDLINGKLTQLSREMDKYPRQTYNKFADPKGDELKAEYDRLLDERSRLGRTYEVNINARPELMLDWDKPWQAQPKLVQEVARASGIHPESTGAMGVREMSDAPMGQLTGRKLQDPNSLMIRNMRDADIPGIRYLDQGSRAPSQFELDRAKSLLANAEMNGDPAWIAKQQANVARIQEMMTKPGTSNYVMFDDRLIDIMRKYGLAGLAPAGLGALAAQDRYQSRGD